MWVRGIENSTQALNWKLILLGGSGTRNGWNRYVASDLHDHFQPVMRLLVAFIEKLINLDDERKYFIVTCGEEVHLAYNRVAYVLDVQPFLESTNICIL